ncbi:MAG: SLC13 family permease [Candidatus Manganitrophus sp.]|nr:SLC13 family permease [Candidatus Manganitrophus sp.]
MWRAVRENLLSIHGLEKLIHGDTMLFILGLTFFVSVISQTRLLETVSMNLLRIFEGRVLATVLTIAGLVSFASGILDGVSMIGLTIRVLVIILVMARIRQEGIEFIIMISVILTTVCGMWLAYGEPPNLIMKSNLSLPDSFFLKYALPMAVVTFLIVSQFISRWLKGAMIPLDELDVLEKNIADVRFHQAARKGEVKEIEDMFKEYAERFGDKTAAVEALYHEGHHPISAMIRAQVDEETVNAFVRDFLGEAFVAPVKSYYHHRKTKGASGRAGVGAAGGGGDRTPAGRHPCSTERRAEMGQTCFYSLPRLIVLARPESRCSPLYLVDRRLFFRAVGDFGPHEDEKTCNPGSDPRIQGVPFSLSSFSFDYDAHGGRIF